MAGIDILAQAFSGANAAFLGDQYARWAVNPGSVDPSWAEYFKTHQLGGGSNGSTGNGASGHTPEPATPAASPAASTPPSKPASATAAP